MLSRKEYLLDLKDGTYVDRVPTGMDKVQEAILHLQQLEHTTRTTAVALPKPVQEETPPPESARTVFQPNDLYPSVVSVFSPDLTGGNL